MTSDTAAPADDLTKPFEPCVIEYDGDGGSPFEGILERIDDLETEIKARDAKNE